MPLFYAFDRILGGLDITFVLTCLYLSFVPTSKGVGVDGIDEVAGGGGEVAADGAEVCRSMLSC